MNNTTKLAFVKTIHTLIWTFYNVVIFYFLYAVITNRIDKWAWTCIGFIALEVIILIVFKGFCPLTLIARKYATPSKHNFDIYLPEWLARYNKHIYTTIVLIAIIILIFKRYQ